MKSNTKLHSLIKLRHLKKASQNNWEMLNNTKQMVRGIVSDVKKIMEEYGHDEAKAQFSSDTKLFFGHIDEMQKSLNAFGLFLQKEKSINIRKSFEKFKDTIEAISNLFDRIASYPDSYFENLEKNEWREIWEVIKSNLFVVQGVGESAYIKSLMIENFTDLETDLLTNEIVKHIPQSFSLLESDKYKQEYLQAVEEIEQESNAKDNLWDRFLNVLAGNIPFQQTPEERVMMRRWLEGEKGEL
ncbi:MAG: hypothetical protein R3E32_28620 [Chitinophagales bacterium]